MSKNIIWFLIRTFRYIFSFLPLRVSVALGGSLGCILWALSRKKVDGAEKRAVRALGIGVTHARKTVRESYINLGRSVAEITRMSMKKLDLDSVAHIHGIDNLDRAISEDRGVIFLTSHMGNWEILAAYVASKGYPMNAIGAEQRDERITDMIIRTRDLYGVKTISKGFNLKSAIRCLRDREILGVLIDQDVRDKGIIAPFLGLPASTPYGPFKMAARLGSPILPVFSVRREDGINHDLYILSPLEVDSGDNPDKDMENAVIKANDLLSLWITKYPGQWMWLYPRWASTEEAE